MFNANHDAQYQQEQPVHARGGMQAEKRFLQGKSALTQFLDPICKAMAGEPHEQADDAHNKKTILMRVWIRRADAT